MSDIERLRSQLHEVSRDATQVADSLAGFQQKFSQQSDRVQGLISGTASGADRDIAEVLDAAGKSLDDAVGALRMAAKSCGTYADQV